MSIITKTGDNGETSLFSGERVSKDDIRIEVNGCLDELDCFLGDAKVAIESDEIKGVIIAIQSDLKLIMLEIACLDNTHAAVGKKNIDLLEALCDHYEKMVEIEGLVILGNSVAGSKLDICRVMARRVERRLIGLTKVATVSENILIYINRLSDLLFILARIFDINS